MSEERAPLSYGEFREKLTANDTDGKPAILTVLLAERKNMAPRGQAAEWKIAVVFVEVRDEKDNPKEIVLNATDYKTVSRYLGSDERQWAGKQIVVAPTTNIFEGKAFEKMHVATPERWEKLMDEARRVASKKK